MRTNQFVYTISFFRSQSFLIEKVEHRRVIVIYWIDFLFWHSSSNDSTNGTLRALYKSGET